jgi:predicted DNA-binding transcriptional regulator AlpA
MQTKLLTIQEVAEILGIKTNTLAIWRIQGKGPIFRKIQNAVRYSEADVEAFINAAARHSTSEHGSPELGKNSRTRHVRATVEDSQL